VVGAYSEANIRLTEDYEFLWRYCQKVWIGGSERAPSGASRLRLTRRAVSASVPFAAILFASFAWTGATRRP